MCVHSAYSYIGKHACLSVATYCIRNGQIQALRNFRINSLIKHNAWRMGHVGPPHGGRISCINCFLGGNTRVGYVILTKLRYHSSSQAGNKQPIAKETLFTLCNVHKKVLTVILVELPLKATEQQQ